MRTMDPRSRPSFLTALAFFGCLLTLPAAATILRVEADGSGDYPTIQDAMDAAVPGDTVLLGPGTYVDSVDRDLNGLRAQAVAFLKSGVLLEGGYGAEETVIDGQFVRHCLVGEHLNPATVVRGVTLWRGHPDGAAGNDIWGGGLLAFHSGVRVESCRIADCEGVGGGGILLWGHHTSGFLREITGPQVRLCVFESNHAADLGGALEIYQAESFLIENNTFLSNSADDRGGAILINEATGDMDRNIFWFNTAGDGGGAIGCIGGAGPFAHGACNLFWQNAAPIGAEVEGCTVPLGLDGNALGDPLFCAPAIGDYRLQADSPAAPAQSGNCGLIGALPVNCGGTGGTEAIALAEILADAGTEVLVPLTVGGFPPFEASSFLTEIRFDPQILSFVRFEKSGTLSEDMLVVAHEVDPGTLRVAGAGTERVGDNDDLLRLYFDLAAGAASGERSAVAFELFEWNEGIAAESLQDGGVTTSPGLMVSGQVSYYASGTPVPDIEISLEGDVAQSTTGTPDGGYAFGGLWFASNLTLRPTFAPPTTEPISAMDASFVLRHLVGLTILDPEQQLAADVSGDGTVSPHDASGILQIVVGDPEAIPDPAWRFVPETIGILSLPGDVAGQDFGAILRGDVTGNWCPDPPCPDGEPGRSLAWTASGAWTDRQFDVVVRVEEAGALGVEFSVTWLPEHLELTATTLPSAGLWTSFETGSSLAVAGASPEGFGAAEAEVTLSFRAIRSPRPASEILVSSFRVDESALEERRIAVGGVALPTEAWGDFDLRVSPTPSAGRVQLDVSGAEGAVRIDIFDVSGRRVRGLGTRIGPGGNASLSWDRRDDQGARIASGIFFARLTSEERTVTRRIVLVH